MPVTIKKSLNGGVFATRQEKSESYGTANNVTERSDRMTTNSTPYNSAAYNNTKYDTTPHTPYNSAVTNSTPHNSAAYNNTRYDTTPHTPYNIAVTNSTPYNSAANESKPSGGTVKSQTEQVTSIGQIQQNNSSKITVFDSQTADGSSDKKVGLLELIVDNKWWVVLAIASIYYSIKNKD
jgi:hypothetical protein